MCNNYRNVLWKLLTWTPFSPSKWKYSNEVINLRCPKQRILETPGATEMIRMNGLTDYRETQYKHFRVLSSHMSCASRHNTAHKLSAAWLETRLFIRCNLSLQNPFSSPEVKVNTYFPHLPSTTIWPSESLPFGDGERDLSPFVNEALDRSLALLYCNWEALLHVLCRTAVPNISGSLEARWNIASGDKYFESERTSVI